MKTTCEIAFLSADETYFAVTDEYYGNVEFHISVEDDVLDDSHPFVALAR